MKHVNTFALGLLAAALGLAACTKEPSETSEPKKTPDAAAPKDATPAAGDKTADKDTKKDDKADTPADVKADVRTDTKKDAPKDTAVKDAQKKDAPAAKAMTTTASGLGIIDSAPGSGQTAKAGDRVLVHYTGWLYENGKRGAKFDSSVDRGEPFGFSIGSGVIQGWSEGVAGMKPGGKRELIIPPSLGYGARGAGNVIPPNATLDFEIEFLKFQ